MVVQKKTYTYDEYAAISELPENRDKILELIDGEIVEKVPSFTPSRIGMRLGRFVDTHVDENNLGYVTGADGGYILSEDDTFNPDVAYISKIRLPELPAREVHGPPDLAIEVKSPTDSKRAMRRKAETYRRYGTKMVWLVFPDEQIVEVYVADEDVKTLGMDDTLDGGDVLPGFVLPVSKIFQS
jgi:Uma2 family endonuclease